MSSSQGLFKASKALMAATAAANAKITAAAKPKARPRSKPTSSAAAEEPRKMTGRQSGILKLSPVSASLQEFLGVPETSRANAVKKVWEYIKLHNLQAPTDKKVILCDNKLKTIFEGKDQVGFLEIGKLLSRHFVKTEV